MGLKQWLERHGVSQRDFANRLEVAPSTLCRVLSGQRNPGGALVRKIAQHTEGSVTPSDLFGFSGQDAA